MRLIALSIIVIVVVVHIFYLFMVKKRELRPAISTRDSTHTREKQTHTKWHHIKPFDFIIILFDITTLTLKRQSDKVKLKYTTIIIYPVRRRRTVPMYNSGNMFRGSWIIYFSVYLIFLLLSCRSVQGRRVTFAQLNWASLWLR